MLNHLFGVLVPSRKKRNFLKSFLFLTTLSIYSHQAMAGETITPPSALIEIDASSVPLRILSEWHASITRNDFSSYQRLSDLQPGLPIELVRAKFDSQVRATPKKILITPPEQIANGNLSVRAVGCLNGSANVAVILLLQSNGTWKVFSSAFAPAWSKTALTC